MGEERDANDANLPGDLGEADKRSDDQMKELRTQAEHHEHHARGDVGGEYHEKPSEEDKRHPHEAGRKAGEEALGVDAHADAHKKQPILVVVMVRIHSIIS